MAVHFSVYVWTFKQQLTFRKRAQCGNSIVLDLPVTNSFNSWIVPKRMQHYVRHYLLNPCNL